jgi:outer membrane protein
MTLFKKVFVLVLLLSWSASAEAQLKIGVVNPQYVLSELPEVQRIEEKMQTFIAEKEQELQQETLRLQKELDDYQQIANSMSDNERATEEARLQGRNSELMQLRQNMQYEVQQRQSKLLAPILQMINDAIAEVAKAENLDYVFNQSVGQGENILLYMDEAFEEKLDISERVLAKLK